MCRLNWVKARVKVRLLGRDVGAGYCRWVLGNWASPRTVRFWAAGVAGWMGKRGCWAAELGCRRWVGLAIIIGL